MNKYTFLKKKIDNLNNVSYLSRKDTYKLSIYNKLYACLEKTIFKNNSNNDVLYPLLIIYPLILDCDCEHPIIHDRMIEKLNIIMDGDADISKLSAGGGTRRKYKY